MFGRVADMKITIQMLCLSFLRTIYWWETELDVAGRRKDSIPRTTRSAAEVKLYAEMGGTQDLIAHKYSDAAAKAIDDCHHLLRTKLKAFPIAGT
jgi:hypothetical protein